MVERSFQESPEETETPTSHSSDADAAGAMRELRELLLGEDRETMSRLQAWLDDPRRRAEDVSLILPDSIALRTRRDHKLTKALAPTVEEVLHVSVKKNPATIADALFPIFGPAIRKAIANAFKELVQALNQALEYSLSVKGLKWRWEALRTGKSFAEVVLSHTLLYRVEQVFLIHRHTGLLLHHVAAPSVAPDAADADMVSGMLTAIQDFVRDSFGAKASEALESLEVGDLTVWVEQGPQALLATVIRGNAPQDFRAVLQDAIETIHLQQAEALATFQGDAAPFEASRPVLESCLRVQLEEREKKTSPWLWAAIALVVAALGVWAFFTVRGNWRWQDYLTRLRAEPGLVVVADHRSGGKYHLTGLRDPLAADPQAILQSTPLDPQTVVSRWEAFQSSHPDFVMRRAAALLQPPPPVRLQFADGVLSASGIASQEWIAEARRLTPMLAGVSEFRDAELVSADEANRQLARLREGVETAVIRFAVGSAEITADQQAVIGELAAAVNRLLEFAPLVNKQVVVGISGYTDKSGSEGINQRLEQERADNVLAALTATGINANNLSVVRLSPSDNRTRAFDRKVSFAVTVTDAPEAPR